MLSVTLHLEPICPVCRGKMPKYEQKVVDALIILDILVLSTCNLEGVCWSLDENVQVDKFGQPSQTDSKTKSTLFSSSLLKMSLSLHLMRN